MKDRCTCTRENELRIDGKNGEYAIREVFFFNRLLPAVFHTEHAFSLMSRTGLYREFRSQRLRNALTFGGGPHRRQGNPDVGLRATRT